MREIGRVQSEFPEKFGVPKQPGLAPSLKALLVFEGEYAQETFWRGIESCSHLWVVFNFHLNGAHAGGTIRPPVLGGQERVGVFATRSPHRPNPLGLSLVKLVGIQQSKGRVELEVLGHDFVHGTPILDIKPYVASHDTPKEASHHWTDDVAAKALLTVKWESGTREKLKESAVAAEEILALDPRPRQSKAESVFGLSFAGWNISFKHDGTGILVLSVAPADTGTKVK